MLVIDCNRRLGLYKANEHGRYADGVTIGLIELFAYVR